MKIITANRDYISNRMPLLRTTESIKSEIRPTEKRIDEFLTARRAGDGIA